MSVSNGTAMIQGAEIFDRNGDRIGVAADPGGDSFMVEEGTLFVKAFYLPKRVITAVGENGVHLGISKGEAEALGRQEPPGESNPWIHEPTPDEPAEGP